MYRKATAIGFKVVAHSPSGNDRGTGCEMLELDELLTHSDLVSLHLPLTDDSRKLFGPRQFERMKPGAYLINTSRGGLVDHDALWRELQSGRISGAGLDVFDPEPPDLSQPLYRDDRVIVSPHAAFLSEESVEDLRVRTARQAVDLLENRRPEHLVNPEVWSSPLQP